MKTLSFRDLKIGRKPSRVLLDVHTQRDQVSFQSGLNLIAAPNGFGKTTLFQTLGGVLPALGGEALLDGRDFTADQVLYVSEYLTFPKFIYPMEWVQFVAQGDASVDLEPWIEGFRLRANMNTFLGRQSQGERRKLTWLGAHASRKPVLLLDEPLDGLDLLAIRSAREMVNAWKAEQRIVCIIAHQMSELLDLATEVYLVRDAKLQPWSRMMGGAASQVSAEEFRSKVLDFYQGTAPVAR